MENTNASSELINLLNMANAREMQVSIQYMLQHSIWFASVLDKKTLDKQKKFISSHVSFWIPGISLRKIAMAEMMHAEIIAERIVRLGGELTSQPDPISVGETTMEMLAIDLNEERGAIELYEKIIRLAQETNDKITFNMFKKIITDEKKHHRIFSDLIHQS
ncbi:MAG: ferritin [Eubacteriaceae bacterium]|nr:ferritin [Eubacteriaceae bacterium]